MRIVEEKILKYEELSDSAKETAKDWWKDCIDYAWWKDAYDSIEAFCKHFNVKIKDYSVCPFAPSWLDTDADNQNFRGIKLKDIDRDAMPTGYYLDCDLWITFYDTWKTTGNPLEAFNEAIEVAVKGIQKDMEWQYSDEAVEEMLIINEYEFTEDGKRYA
jgi:hypothetical protein